MLKPQRKQRAEEILNAADALFGERGYDAVSMRDIAERAGVKKAGVFYYFDGKESLLEQVLERYYAAHHAALSEAFIAEGPLRERVHGAIDAYLDFIDTHRSYPRLVQGLVVGRPELHRHIQKNLEPLFRWTQAALAEVAPESGPLAARQFFLTLSGAVINTFTYAPVLQPMWGSDPLSDEAISERRAHMRWLVDVLMDGLETQNAQDGDAR